ncbi:major acid phosphatase map (histidine-acid phosphatase) [Stylonychia lemnae]|uniref:Major acid phosphatase map (Histidine-acid phosphatase) n=1 Tax=Stylonychia lemnae TaxID=5949 RepID=A0A078A3Y2_STYLE|nr:major acid phosphatase map (histidine-acid phosphatase) [Stylonychia lemnae]|eukprot:CDW76973.1 major acid phosphatase map (histidine-acid phosphatase) [Stylonychia lemnae]
MRQQIPLIIYLSLLLFVTQQAEKLGFVFELVRHGARAPLVSSPQCQFQVGDGMLTASGMRQRYFLGKLNREKYIENQPGFLNEQFYYSQIQVQSTNVFRVIQSSYAELLGTFSTQNKKTQLPSSSVESLKVGKGMPKIKIRNKIENILKESDVLDNITLLPVYNFLKPNLKDNITETGCPYAGQQYNSAWYNPAYYEGYNEMLLAQLRQPYTEAFKLNKFKARFMNFTDLYEYSDILLGEEAENTCPKRFNFSEEQQYYNCYVQYLTLVLDFQDITRKLFVSKLLEMPIQNIMKRIDEISNGDKDQSTLRYMIYSGHDVQIANVLTLLNPIEIGDVYQIPYGSTFYIELYYDDDCIKNTKTENDKQNCFWVQVIFNGKQLSFDTCQNESKLSKDELFIHKRCSFNNFLSHLDKNQYKGDMIEQCKKDFIN